MTRNGARWTKYEDRALRMQWFDPRTTPADMEENLQRFWTAILRRKRQLHLGPRPHLPVPHVARALSTRKRAEHKAAARFQRQAAKAAQLRRMGWSIRWTAHWCGLKPGQVEALGI